MAARRIALLWYRNDLRLADHEPLTTASTDYDSLLPFACLDPAQYAPRMFEGLEPLPLIPREGPHKAQLRLDALRALSQSFAAQNSGLSVRVGSTTAYVADLLAQLSVSGASSETPLRVDLLHHLEMGPDAAELEARVQSCFLASLRTYGWRGEVRTFWNKTLYHPDDVDPYFHKGKSDGPPSSKLPINNDPERFKGYPAVMTNFRKALQGCCEIRQPLPAPTSLPPLPFEPCDSLPSTPTALYEALDLLPALRNLESLTNLPAGSSRWDSRSAFPFEASEAAAHQRLHTYMFGSQPSSPSSEPLHVRHPLLIEADEGRAGNATGAPRDAPFFSTFAATKAQGVGVENSTKLSPYLSLGLLTARQVHRAVADYAQTMGAAGDGVETHWLVMHLSIRDFYIYSALGAGAKLAQLEGLKSAPVGAASPWKMDLEALGRWARGQTGLPFVDANMRELAATGFQSNRGRQNVASFLAKALHIDWRAGCALFEALLLDHDWAVNTTCWAYVAGTGNDPKNRFFKTVTQGETYDDQAHLIRMWIPELSHVEPAAAHQPWTLDGQHRIAGYPEPMVDPATMIQPAREPSGKDGRPGNTGNATSKGKKGKGGGKEWMQTVSEQLLKDAAAAQGELK